MPKNHSTDALAKPQMKNTSLPAGRLARNAPSIMVPSMMACGLNHVTTQAVEITFQMGTFTSRPPSMLALERKSPIPIQMTMRLPMPRMTFCSQGRACISAPTPRKQARPSVMSKKMTISAVR